MFPIFRRVLLESHQLADKGLFSDATIAISFSLIPRSLHLKANPDFFAGTAIVGAVAKLNA